MFYIYIYFIIELEIIYFRTDSALTSYNPSLGFWSSR